MKMTITALNTWLRGLENSKPYRIMLKNGAGFYELLFWYGDYHYNDRLTVKDLEDELECQKKILNMCSVFEKNMKLKVF